MKSIALFFLITVWSIQLSYANPLDVACQKPTTINDTQFKKLVALGKQLINEEKKLVLPEDCATIISLQKKQIQNPYIIALQVAANEKSTADLSKTLNTILPSKLSIEEKGEKHSDLLRYIKIACGDQLGCVTSTIRNIPNLSIAESPIFCSFSRFADYSVQIYFQTHPTVSYPVACLGHSSLTAGQGLSPMQDWFEAYKQLGE